MHGFPLRREWYLVQRQGKRLSPAAQAFAQFVLSEAGGVAPLDELACTAATSNFLSIERTLHYPTMRFQSNPKCDGARPDPVRLLENVTGLLVYLVGSHSILGRGVGAPDIASKYIREFGISPNIILSAACTAEK